MDWSEGYVTDIGYVRGYYRELSPLFQSFSLSLAGREPPDLSAPFTKLELGCGYGLSVLMEAAVFPHAQFYGVDFMPEHIAWAKRIAAQAGLENVHFYELSFVDLMGSAIPDVDFVAMHGVWSWVSAENRQAILRFLDKRLKSGGVVLNSYNVLPGWAAQQGLRELMMRKYRSTSGPSGPRIEEALQFAQSVRTAEAGLFKTYPQLGEYLDGLMTKPKRYLAHEYFNQDWHLFYQHQVAEMFAGVRMAYAGSCRPTENLGHLNYTPAALKLISSVAPGEQETLKDTFASRMFRYDMYSRGLEALAIPYGSMMDMTFVLTGDPGRFADGTFKAQVGVVKYKKELSEPITSRLLKGPAVAREFMAQPGHRALLPAQIAEILAVLIDTDIVSPALPVAQAAAVAERTKRLNTVLLQRLDKGEESMFLVSPVTGLAHHVQNMEMTFLLAMSKGKEPVAGVWESLKAQGKKMVREG
ncbi:MAG: class I SAM-dependent methyltransferase, partial [Rhodospirillaceae bacterium]|nr:class I SAM-dependent methyltransferase [Rhodospirillaceae bacterium]